MSNYAHIRLYPDDFKDPNVWKTLCKICEGDENDDVLIVNFQRGMAMTIGGIENE